MEYLSILMQAKHRKPTPSSQTTPTSPPPQPEASPDSQVGPSPSTDPKQQQREQQQKIFEAAEQRLHDEEVEARKREAESGRRYTSSSMGYHPRPSPPRKPREHMYGDMGNFKSYFGGRMEEGVEEKRRIWDSWLNG
ncbi:uncharacterized protein BDZ99DRAFT_165302 [Mytilinidion resinicola]|uniref:Uncharacterized protein n=1 Tax=Mytilinidion resinicola TaxID=574789 RepID=A0A6A6Y6N6_9PEZI|nr:uncharacterized protein BDZ99DRAFT_165302 [Mytilinidion resinicola]KAF2803467.1 hypothetical protein BDZ99DRAFT_165302 [Mytilinidion resinicola]